MRSVGQRARRHEGVYEHLVGVTGESHVWTHEPHISTCGAVCACVSPMDPHKELCVHV